MHCVYTTMTDGPPFGTAPTTTNYMLQTLLQGFQSKVRRVEEFFHGRGADDFCGFEDDVGAGPGIIQGLVMAEGVAEIAGDGI